MVRIAGVIKESIVDGPGIRLTLFTQGCTHGCRDCHNPQTHALDGGYECSAAKIIDEVSKNPLLSGITFSGGEPILQAKQLVEVAKGVTNIGKTCFVYSGFTFEQLLEKNDADVIELLSLCDYLVDGLYIAEQRDMMLHFRGSRNQRIIDLKASLLKMEAISVEL